MAWKTNGKPSAFDAPKRMAPMMTPTIVFLMTFPMRPLVHLARNSCKPLFGSCRNWGPFRRMRLRFRRPKRDKNCETHHGEKYDRNGSNPPGRISQGRRIGVRGQ